MSKYPMSGVMSRVKERASDKHPEFNGSAEIEGKEYWINAWVNDGAKGKYFKLSFKEKEARNDVLQAPDVPADDDFSDEIPF